MAGVITAATPITEQAVEGWDLVFLVNARGIFNCLRAQLRAMGNRSSIVSYTPLNLDPKSDIVTTPRLIGGTLGRSQR